LILPNDLRVGLVDADEGIRVGRRMVLESSGRVNVTFESSSAQDVIDRFPDYLLDVLIIDQRLRGLSGVEVCEKLSAIKFAEGIDTRLLMTSPYGSSQLEYSALFAGASSIVSQEQGSVALIEAVLALGDRKRQYSMLEIRTLAAGNMQNAKRDHELESHLAEFEIRERSILQGIVNGRSVSQVAKAFDVASYRVRKLVEASLKSLQIVTLEQLQLRYLKAGLGDDV